MPPSIHRDVGTTASDANFFPSSPSSPATACNAEGGRYLRRWAKRETDFCPEVNFAHAQSMERQD